MNISSSKRKNEFEGLEIEYKFKDKKYGDINFTYTPTIDEVFNWLEYVADKFFDIEGSGENLYNFCSVFGRDKYVDDGDDTFIDNIHSFIKGYGLEKDFEQFFYDSAEDNFAYALEEYEYYNSDDEDLEEDLNLSEKVNNRFNDFKKGCVDAYNKRKKDSALEEDAKSGLKLDKYAANWVCSEKNISLDDLREYLKECNRRD